MPERGVALQLRHIEAKSVTRTHAADRESILSSTELSAAI